MTSYSTCNTMNNLVCIEGQDQKWKIPSSVVNVSGKTDRKPLSVDIKADLDESEIKEHEKLKEESDLIRYCNMEEKGNEVIDIDDEDIDDDDNYIIVSFDSSGEEDGESNVKEEDTSSKGPESQPKPGLPLINSNEMTNEFNEWELTSFSKVSSLYDAIEPVENIMKISAKYECDETEEAKKSTLNEAEEISGERKSDEDLKNMQLSSEMKRKERVCLDDAQAVYDDHQPLVAKHAHSTSSPKIDELLKRGNETTIQTLINQLGLKAEMKTITNEDGSEKLEVHFVMDENINLKELAIPLAPTSASSTKISSNEVSSTICDAVEYLTKKEISAQTDIAQEIQQTKKSENSSSRSTEVVTEQNVRTIEKPACSEVDTLSFSTFVENIRNLDQEEEHSKREKCDEVTGAASSDVICLSSDEEDEPAIHSATRIIPQEIIEIPDEVSTEINQPPNEVKLRALGKKSVRDQGSQETTNLIDQTDVNSKNSPLQQVSLNLKRRSLLKREIRPLSDSHAATVSAIVGSRPSSPTLQSHMSSPLNAINRDPKDITYTCYICSKKFLTPELIQQHLRKFHSYYPRNTSSVLSSGFFCCHCNEVCVSLHGLSIHEKTVHGFKFSCPLCGILQKNDELLMNHISDHLSPWVLCCFLCKQEFQQHSVFMEHVALHHENKKLNLGKLLKCCICNKIFAHLETFCGHLDRDHKRLFKYSCRVCCQRFCTPSALRVHRSSSINILDGSRVKIAKQLSIDPSLLEVRVDEDVLLRDDHRRYLCKQFRPSNDTSFKVKEMRRKSLDSNSNTTVTNKRTMYHSEVSTTENRGDSENKCYNFSNRQSSVNWGTVKDRILNDFPNLNIAMNRENNSLKQQSVKKCPEKNAKYGQTEKGKLIPNWRILQSNKEVCVGLKRKLSKKNSSAVAESRKGDEDTLTPPKQLRLDPHHHVKAGMNGCSEQVQESDNKSTEDNKKSGASYEDSQERIPSTVCDLIDLGVRKHNRNSNHTKVEKNILHDTPPVNKSKAGHIPKELENSTTGTHVLFKKVQDERSAVVEDGEKNSGCNDMDSSKENAGPPGMKVKDKIDSLEEKKEPSDGQKSQSFSISCNKKSSCEAPDHSLQKTKTSDERNVHAFSSKNKTLFKSVDVEEVISDLISFCKRPNTSTQVSSNDDEPSKIMAPITSESNECISSDNEISSADSKNHEEIAKTTQAEVQSRKKSATSAISKVLTSQKYVYNESDLDNAVKRLSSVVKTISKRKLIEYGPADPSEEQTKEKHKHLKMIPIKDLLQNQNMHVSKN
ncbi:uncharacterized protein LOC134259356 isoform X2 [Saccostrea cucullata]|uniref:uncharacterized protein LOC134259356 isoform X2 n=1 Tax=Saccostrea cuccullata TaxID=36930 RepID=UPI002ED3C3DE